MNIDVTYTWVPVENDPGSPYCFPQVIGRRFSATWKQQPAVYRWNLYERELDDLSRIYIGQTVDLRKRLSGYLKPGPSQQTNQRLNAELSSELQKGRVIALEVLEFEPFDLDEVTVRPADLSIAAVRRLLEALFETYYKKLGWQVLNI